MSLDKARGFTKKAMQKRKDARAMEAHNPKQAAKLHKKADKASNNATIQRENVRGKPNYARSTTQMMTDLTGIGKGIVTKEKVQAKKALKPKK